MKLAADQVEAYHERGEIYAAMGDYLHAIEFYEKALIKNGQDPARVGHWDEVREAFKTAGERGYWSKLLEYELKAVKPDAHNVAICLAHLRRMEEAYDWLQKACDERTLENLWADSIWDHKNPRFQSDADGSGYNSGRAGGQPRKRRWDGQHRPIQRTSGGGGGRFWNRLCCRYLELHDSKSDFRGGRNHTGRTG